MTNDEALLKVVAMLAQEGVSLMIVGSGECGLSAWFEDGFYKSDGMARLVVENGRLFLRARYDKKTEIGCIDDVVRCSKEWHKYSEKLFEGWETPPANWQRLYTRLDA